MAPLTLSPEAFDATKPHPARMWDYLLGGKDHFAPDREMIEQVIDVFEEFGQLAFRARRWHRNVIAKYGRAAVYLADLGCGMPVAAPTHALELLLPALTFPGKPERRRRTLYLDEDALVIVHANALMATADTMIAHVDLGDDETVIAAFVGKLQRELPNAPAGLGPAINGPVLTMLTGVIDFLDDDTLAGLLAVLRTISPPGSKVALTHITPALSEAIGTYNATTKSAPIAMRDKQHMRGLLADTGWNAYRKTADAGPKHRDEPIQIGVVAGVP